MSVATLHRGRVSRRGLVVAGAVVVLLAALSQGVHVVRIGSSAAAGPQAFSAAEYGRTQFPKVAEAITKKAVPAPTLAQAIAADPAAAATKYGVATSGGLGPEFSVQVTGVAGAAADGVYTLKVAGVPADLVVRVQTGPAVNGTDLRDATGTIAFGQFVNQIDYQNAGAALNAELKKQVLSKLGTGSLTGRTVTLTGAFQLVNPKGWLITPVEMSVS